MWQGSADSTSNAEPMDDDESFGSDDEFDDTFGLGGDFIGESSAPKIQIGDGNTGGSQKIAGFETRATLPHLLTKPKKIPDKTKNAEDIMTAKQKNREHAKNTRIRKKNYVESLKDNIVRLTEEREKLDRDRKVAANRLSERANTRRKVVQEVMQIRGNGVLDRSLWLTLIEESFTLVLPITPYRSFPPSEVCTFCSVYSFAPITYFVSFGLSR